MINLFRNFTFGLVIFLAVIAASTQAQAQQVREIPNPNLPDIEMASYDAYGPVIFYNPIIVAQAGPLIWEFFRAHEYGHIYNRSADEMAADYYATVVLMRSNPAAVEAFIQFKAAQGMGGGDATHLPGMQRAMYVDSVRRRVLMSQ